MKRVNYIAEVNGRHFKARHGVIRYGYQKFMEDVHVIKNPHGTIGVIG